MEQSLYWREVSNSATEAILIHLFLFASARARLRSLFARYMHIILYFIIGGMEGTGKLEGGRCILAVTHSAQSDPQERHVRRIQLTEEFILCSFCWFTD